MTRTYNPSIKTIASRLSWLSNQEVKAVRGLIDGSLDPIETSETIRAERHWVKSVYNNLSEIELIMNAIDSIMCTHGVEAIYNAGDLHPTAVYCNTGEAYATTVLYCYKTRRFLVTSWGDYYEKNLASED
jgi:hypothetical protein